MDEHFPDDILGSLDKPGRLADKLRLIHHNLEPGLSCVERIAIAVYDKETDLLRTLAHSTRGGNPLPLYQASLTDVPTLANLCATGRNRIVKDMHQYEDNASAHSHALLDAGMQSSFTLTMHSEGEFLGFVFFNSARKDAFSKAVVDRLSVVGHLIEMVLIQSIAPARILIGAVKTARAMASRVDSETGAHMDRTGHYSKIIARRVAPAHLHDDEWVDHIFRLAPLHDIGKIGIPEGILTKPGPLDAEEERLVRTHTVEGRHIVDQMLHEFHLDQVQGTVMLRNIVAHHHECLDGSGYPTGLKGNDIPLEARIVAVADIFDALTSPRPYKPAWPMGRALVQLHDLKTCNKLDRGCVDALIASRAEIAAVQESIPESIVS